MKKLSNTMLRVITAAVLILIAVAAGVLEMHGIHVVRWLVVAITALMLLEFVWVIFGQNLQSKFCHSRAGGNRALARSATALQNKPLIICAIIYLLAMVVFAYFVGAKPGIILLLLLIIVATDVGAWFIGKLVGGDKMWPAISPNKTWSGQIGGIVFGTIMAIMYGAIGAGQFMISLMWIGISVALLSQYGDLLASWVKRKLGIKDFSNILPGHGGIIDRFDGWLIVLPLIAITMG